MVELDCLSILPFCGVDPHECDSCILIQGINFQMLQSILLCKGDISILQGVFLGGEEALQVLNLKKVSLFSEPVLKIPCLVEGEAL